MNSKFSILFIVLLTITVFLHAQIDFKYDSVVYKTMYAKDLCRFLSANPNALLIDVRTPGEYADTSSFASLNIGHLKGAINIEIDSFAQAIPGLKKNTDQPIVLYCSHSQRSRRVSKTLVENGFTNVLNLNGGMSWLNQADEIDFPCKKEMIVSSLPYKSIPADEAIQEIKKNKDLIILDARSKMQFDGTDTLESNNIGRIKNAINIPADQKKEVIPKVIPDKNKTILVYDDHGVESNAVAKYLVESGYTKVYRLLGGIKAIIGEEKESIETRKQIMEGMPKYNLLNVREATNLLKKNHDVIIIDIRPVEEFTNKSETKWRNIGHIKNAINIPPAEFESSKQELLKYKKSTLLVYGSKNTAKFCKELADEGFLNVNLLYGGLWDMVSSTANISSMKDAKPLLVDHEGLY